MVEDKEEDEVISLRDGEDTAGETEGMKQAEMQRIKSDKTPSKLPNTEVQPLNDELEIPPRLKIHEEEASEDSEEELSCTQTENNATRVRKPIWNAMEGFGRCKRGCEGCAATCAEQGLPNCQNCHLNIVKNTSNYGCRNRKECLELKPKLVRVITDKASSLKKPLTKNLSIVKETTTARTEKIVSPMVQEIILHFSGRRDKEDKRKRDSERSPGGTPKGKG